MKEENQFQNFFISGIFFFVLPIICHTKEIGNWESEKKTCFMVLWWWWWWWWLYDSKMRFRFNFFFLSVQFIFGYMILLMMMMMMMIVVNECYFFLRKINMVRRGSKMEEKNLWNFFCSSTLLMFHKFRNFFSPIYFHLN